MKVVAPIVTTSPSCNTARSRSLNNSWRRNVPVRLGLSLTVSIGRLPFSFTLMMQWRRSMLMSLVSMGISTSVPFDARPIILSPACKGNSCRYPNAFSNTVMKPREVSMSFLWHEESFATGRANERYVAGNVVTRLVERKRFSAFWTDYLFHKYREVSGKLFFFVEIIV